MIHLPWTRICEFEPDKHSTMADNISPSRRRLTINRHPDTLTSQIYVGILSSHALAADYLVALVKQHDPELFLFGT